MIPFRTWLAARASGVKISLIELFLMRIRRVEADVIVNALILSSKAGLNLSRNQLEDHYLSGGNVPRVVNALLSAEKANISLDFEKACLIDLAGRDVLEVVQMVVEPRIIQVQNVAAISQDGIQLIVSARLTVRGNVDRIIGGAGEETIVARVREAIISGVGSSESYTKVLEQPELLSQWILSKEVDKDTMYSILSVEMSPSG